MTTDITSHVLAAIRQRHSWTPERALELAERSSLLVGGRVDWDRGAGENWARLHDGPEVVFAISTLLPIGLVRCTSKIVSAARDVILLEFSDWDGAELSSTREVILDAFELQRDWPESIDERAFSPSDLWWMTV